MSTMTLEQVRDELRGLASDGGFGRMADAIDAALAHPRPTGEQAGEVVAYRLVSKHKAALSGAWQDGDVPDDLNEAGVSKTHTIQRAYAQTRAVGGPDGCGPRSDDSDRHEALGRVMEDASRRLPDGWEIRVELERYAGTVRLHDPDGNEVQEEFGGGDFFHEEIEEAIAHALAAEGGVCAECDGEGGWFFTHSCSDQEWVVCECKTAAPEVPRG